ncbi:hypothetical protein QC761_0064660 [Podospora bellae-mahoneyi]|uniref:Uncharacterized protein n=1 Tax=Podospora bellae-mahoneyi TaxID=2093777 RepID=A0ABR0FK27_9PEZI|nr:hypothetical protein QC761_0064660 [Podospora bellae-mahoneyi]
MPKNSAEMVANSSNRKTYRCMLRICCTRQRDVASHECGCGTLAQVLARCWCPLAVATSECNNSVPHGVEDGGKHMSSIGDAKNRPVSVTKGMASGKEFGASVVTPPISSLAGQESEEEEGEGQTLTPLAVYPVAPQRPLLTGSETEA